MAILLSIAMATKVPSAPWKSMTEWQETMGYEKTLAMEAERMMWRKHFGKWHTETEITL
jgi:hypothetical protein